MTNFEKIKQIDDVNKMAKFLAHVFDGSVVPLTYTCDNKFCGNCPNKQSCFERWLKQEVEE